MSSIHYYSYQCTITFYFPPKLYIVLNISGNEIISYHDLFMSSIHYSYQCTIKFYFLPKLYIVLKHQWKCPNYAESEVEEECNIKEKFREFYYLFNSIHDFENWQLDPGKAVEIRKFAAPQ